MLCGHFTSICEIYDVHEIDVWLCMRATGRTYVYVCVCVRVCVGAGYIVTFVIFTHNKNYFVSYPASPTTT